MVFTNEIIDRVKQYPILFNPNHSDYKNNRAREIVWSKLANELNEDRIELKKKWKNIRDCYKKYLRSMSGTILRSYKNWQWAKDMEFCKPFVLSDAEINRMDIENIDDVDDPFLELESSQAWVTETPEERQQDSLELSNNSELFIANKIIRHLEQNKMQVLNIPDATDLIFLGYSSMVKSFNPTKQAIIKMKIAQLIMEEELQNAQGIPFQSHLVCKPTSSKGNLNNSTLELHLTDEDLEATKKPKRTRKRKMKTNNDEIVEEFNSQPTDETTAVPLSPVQTDANEVDIDLEDNMITTSPNEVQDKEDSTTVVKTEFKDILESD